MAIEPRPQYVDKNPDTRVENVFPLANQPPTSADVHHDNPSNQPENIAELDVRSWQEMGRFLERRHIDVTPDGSLESHTIMRPHESSELRFRKWGFLPPVHSTRGWWRATVAGLLALNAALNVGNLKTALEDSREEVANLSDNVTKTLYNVEVCPDTSSNGDVESIISTTYNDSFFVSANESGKATPNTETIDRTLSSISSALGHGDKVQVTITSIASDEWLSLPDEDRGIGKDTKNNTDLAQSRSENFKEALINSAEEAGVDISNVSIKTASSEHVLNKGETSELLNNIDKFDLSIDEVILAANQGKFNTLPRELRKQLKSLVTSERGVHVTITSTNSELSLIPPQTTGDPDNVRCVEGSPSDEDHDYNWNFLPFIWPALPLFMRRRITSMIPEQYVTSQPNPLDVLIHPDGVNEDVTETRKDVWAYLRKYMHLLREDSRIQTVQELSYEDGEGEPLELRVMYVDHKPTEESLAMVEDVLQTATTITSGRIGRNVDMIVVYPRESAGRQRGSRQGRDIAIGLDTQYDSSTLGVAFGNFGLVELHMDQEPTSKDLDESYMSAKWTLVHELLGHFTHIDHSVNQRQIKEVGQTPDGRTLHETPVVWSTEGADIFKRAQAFAEQMAQHNADVSKIHWLAWLPDSQDPIDIYGVSDPRLLEAERLEIYTTNTSHYGDTIHYEAYAEAAASHVTGIAVPFEDSPLEPVRNILRRHPEQGISGTMVNKEWVAKLAQAWGEISDKDRKRLEASWKHKVGKPEEFEFIQALASFARNAEIWSQEDPRWIRIITGQLFNEENDLD